MHRLTLASAASIARLVRLQYNLTGGESEFQRQIEEEKRLARLDLNVHSYFQIPLPGLGEDPDPGPDA